MKVFVIHAAKLVERGKHIKRMLDGLNLPFEFVKEADADMLTEEILDKYLIDGVAKMHHVGSHASCTIKHLMVCEKIVSEHLDGALVLEDDIVLHNNFLPIFQKSIVELREDYANQPVIISYEDSSLQFVPRSKRKKGKVLYVGDKDRTAGAYYVSYEAAQAIVNDVNENRCQYPIDGYHNYLLHKGIIKYLWCHPTIASQGSFTGAFSSSLSHKNDMLIRLRWSLKKNYKTFLYWLR